jgi:hypothetical protein
MLACRKGRKCVILRWNWLLMGAPWMSGLEEVRDNWKQDSVMRITRRKVHTRWFYGLNSRRWTLRQEQEWYWLAYLHTTRWQRKTGSIGRRWGKDYSWVMRCGRWRSGVGNSVARSEEDFVSNVKSNIIYLRKRQKDLHVITGMLHWTREVQKDYMGDCDTYQGSPVTLTFGSIK